MGIPESEWLVKAKRQAIHSENRGYHNREARPNLVVGNKPDRWWCYCHSCKQGGVVMKSHVALTNTPEPINSRSLVLPEDMVRLNECSNVTQLGIAAFLAHKHMDGVYLPQDMYYSDSRKRLIFYTRDGRLGRDLTGRSPSKWLTYDNQTHLDGTTGSKFAKAVIVEDPFSYFKVWWAMRQIATDVTVYSSLGTRIHDKLLVKVLSNHSHVMMFYDGDEAGQKGAAQGRSKLRGMGISAYDMCAPTGLDPKDMSVLAIQSVVLSFLVRTQSTS